jgi:hypothetical protein
MEALLRDALDALRLIGFPKRGTEEECLSPDQCFEIARVRFNHINEKYEHLRAAEAKQCFRCGMKDGKHTDCCPEQTLDKFRKQP